MPGKRKAPEPKVPAAPLMPLQLIPADGWIAVYEHKGATTYEMVIAWVLMESEQMPSHISLTRGSNRNVTGLVLYDGCHPVVAVGIEGFHEFRYLGPIAAGMLAPANLTESERKRQNLTPEQQMYLGPSEEDVPIHREIARRDRRRSRGKDEPFVKIDERGGTA